MLNLKITSLVAKKKQAIKDIQRKIPDEEYSFQIPNEAFDFANYFVVNITQIDRKGNILLFDTNYNIINNATIG